MKLYIIDSLELPANKIPERMNSLLSSQRYQKVQRLRSHTGRNVSAAAYLLLRYALRELYNINEPVDFNIKSKGKPTLEKYPHIHFNLSHSKNAAACVVADFEVGVDIQNIRNVTGKTAKRVLTEEEYETFRTTLNPAEYFCKIWTIKESYVKMTGQGITMEFGEISAKDISNIYTIKGDDYYCSVCSLISAEKPPHAVLATISEVPENVKILRREDLEQLYK
ncbi:MAG: 4'-phosphopantetheinyl transferase superfamily protein [Oscillospiraceae bacterium]|nr:4'-phosphopantetheinyl transferase superfamily protein [Oscillospiraceae bacterium]